MKHWELMGNGLGTREVCGRVAVSRSTGHRCRAEMGGVISRPRSATKCCYLSMRERQRIRALRAQGLANRLIAARIGRSPSRVSRELARNMAPWDPAN